MMLAEIAEYLEAEVVSIGTVWIGGRPSDPDTAVVLTPYPGEGPIQVFGDDLPKTRRVRFQLLARARNYDVAEPLIDAAFKKLCVVVGMDFDGMEITLEPMTDIFSLGHDESGRSLLAANFRAHRND